MFVSRLRVAILAIAASLGVSACAYDDGYGYGGVSVGYGGYYDPYYGSYGYYGRPAYYGWYGGYYYPGTGFYIYDRWGKRHRWSERHRRYWHGRRGHHRHVKPNWGGYHHHQGQRVQRSAPVYREQVRPPRRGYQQQRSTGTRQAPRARAGTPRISRPDRAAPRSPRWQGRSTRRN